MMLKCQWSGCVATKTNIAFAEGLVEINGHTVFNQVLKLSQVMDISAAGSRSKVFALCRWLLSKHLHAGTGKNKSIVAEGDLIF